MGHLSLNGQGIYGLMGVAFMGGAIMASCCFVWKYAQKCWSSGDSLGTRPSKNRKGGSGASAGVEVYTAPGIKAHIQLAFD